MKLKLLVLTTIPGLFLLLNSVLLFQNKINFEVNNNFHSLVNIKWPIYLSLQYIFQYHLFSSIFMNWFIYIIILAFFVQSKTDLKEKTVIAFLVIFNRGLLSYVLKAPNEYFLEPLLILLVINAISHDYFKELFIYSILLLFIDIIFFLPIFLYFTDKVLQKNHYFVRGFRNIHLVALSLIMLVFLINTNITFTYTFFLEIGLTALPYAVPLLLIQKSNILFLPETFLYLSYLLVAFYLQNISLVCAITGVTVIFYSIKNKDIFRLLLSVNLGRLTVAFCLLSSWGPISYCAGRLFIK